jgi:hypothetical protein
MPSSHSLVAATLATSNSATIVRGAVIVSVQVRRTSHGLVQPANFEPSAWRATSVTCSPPSRRKRQISLQSRVSPATRIVPCPSPAFVTVSVKCSALTTSSGSSAATTVCVVAVDASAERRGGSRGNPTAIAAPSTARATTRKPTRGSVLSSPKLRSRRPAPSRRCGGPDIQ